MKPNYSVSKFIILGLLLFLNYTNVSGQEDKNLLTISGFVEVTELDANNNVIQVAVIVPNKVEDEMDFLTYIVVNDTIGKEFLKLTSKNVEVTGTLKPADDGKIYLTVKNYTIIPEQDDEDFDLPDDDDDE